MSMSSLASSYSLCLYRGVQFMKLRRANIGGWKAKLNTYRVGDLLFEVQASSKKKNPELLLCLIMFILTQLQFASINQFTTPKSFGRKKFFIDVHQQESQIKLVSMFVQRWCRFCRRSSDTALPHCDSCWWSGGGVEAANLKSCHWCETDSLVLRPWKPVWNLMISNLYSFVLIKGTWAIARVMME